MSGPTPDEVLAAEVVYNRFNAERSVHPRASALEERPFGVSRGFRDRNRDDPAWNRIVVAHDAVGPDLVDARRWFGAIERPVRVHAADPAPAWLAGGPWSAEATDAWFGGLAVRIDVARPGLRRVGAGEVDAVFDLWQACGSEPLPEVQRARGRASFADPRFPQWLGWEGDRAVAGATLFLTGDLGLLGNAETLPAFRRRGWQTDLIRARLDETARRGHRWALCDTAPGSTSARNLVRAGMRPLFTATTWRLAPG